MKKVVLLIGLAAILLFSGCTTKPQANTNAPPAGPKDCGTDFDCFIAASQSCEQAKGTSQITTTIFGVQQTTASSLEIKGIQSGKCLFYLKTEKIELTFPPSVPQDTVQQQKDIYKKLEGRDGTCKFNTTDLTAVLTRWKAGNFSTEDFKVAECEGSYFSNQIQ